MLFLILFNLIISQICGFFLPCIMADIVDIGIKQHGFVDMGIVQATMSESEIIRCQTSYILSKGAIMAGITLIVVILDVFTGYIISKISADMSLKLRRDVFLKISDFSYRDYDKFSVSSLITRATSDVESVKIMVLSSTKMVILPFMIGGGIFMAIQKSASMSSIMAWGSVGAVVCVTACFLLVTPKVKIFQKLFDNFNQIIKERLSGVQLIRVFGKEEFERKKFKKSNEKLTSTSLFINKITIMMVPILTAIINFMTVFIVWVGAENISKSSMNVGDVMAFLQYATMVITAFVMLSITISSMPKFWVSAERIFEVLDTETVIKNEGKKFIENINLIEFKNVEFRYPEAEENVLSNLNFTIKAGDRIAITGTTGSGKSTLIKLLLGFYAPSKGSILVNGTDLKDIDKKNFLEKISYVPQDGTLFSGKLSSNLRIGNENATKDEMKRSLEIAQISDFVNENGFEFEIMKNGNNISGGQRQRIAIARAILRSADMYVFDDSFSRLDFKTDSNLRKALNTQLKDTVKVTVSQRIGTIKQSDMIIVLDEGKISGIGTHEKLMLECEIYKNMAELQLGKEEAK